MIVFLVSTRGKKKDRFPDLYSYCESTAKYFSISHFQGGSPVQSSFILLASQNGRAAAVAKLLLAASGIDVNWDPGRNCIMTTSSLAQTITLLQQN